MKIRLDTSQAEARIEAWPLVNVGFCVLTFFVLTSLPLAPQAFNINVPLPRNSASSTRKMLIVSIDIAGQTYVEQQPVTREQLSQTLAGFRQTQPEGLIVLYAPKLAVYSDVVQVLDLLRSVGGDRVALATLPETTTPALPQNPGFIVPGNTPPSPATPGFPSKANPNLADPLNPYGTSSSPLPILPSPTVIPSPSGLPSPSPASSQPYIIPNPTTPATKPAPASSTPSPATPAASPSKTKPISGSFNSASPGTFSGTIPATTPGPSPLPRSNP